MASFDEEVQAELDKRKSEKQLAEGSVTPDTKTAVAETPAIEAAPVAPPAAPIVEPESTDFDTQVEAELQKRKLAAQQTPAEPAKPTEPTEPDYVTKFRAYGPSKDDEDVKTTLELLSPQERNDLIKVHPWAYSKLNAKQQDEIFEESRKSKPITGADIASVAGSLLGSGVDLVKSAAEVLGDAGSAYALAPIKQAIKNKSWFEVKGENAIVQEAQDKLDTDARNLSGAVPSTIIRTTRMIQKMFGGKDLNSIANPIQRAIATLAPTDLQNVVGDPIPEKNAAQPNFWSIVPTNTGIIPFDIVTKIAQASTDKDAGGIAAVDRLNEMLGISDKDQSRTRDHIRRLYDAEVGAEDWKASNGQKKLSPWSQVAFSDVGQQAILFRERSLLPSVEFIAEHDGISLDQAQEKRNQIAEINAEKATNELTREWNKDFDPSMEFLGSLFLGDAAFGEAGLALGAGKLAGPLLQKASTLGMTDREVSRYYDALQKLEKAKLIARQKDMSQPSWWGKSAEYVEKKQDEVTAAGQTLFENLPAPVKAAAPLAGKALAKVGLGGIGGGVGALLDPENPSVGMLEGLTLSTGLGIAPSVLRSVDRARRLIGAGEGKLFTEVAKAQESSLPARLIFNKATGPVIDYIAENSTALFKSGVNLGALSAVTSTLNSDDPEEFNQAVADGFGMGMGFHLAHGITGRIHGKDPAQDLNNRRKRDVEIFEAVKTASPATQGMLEQVSNYQTAVDRVDALVVRSESNLQQAAAKGNEKETKLAADALKNAMALQKEVLRANVQTRNEYGRSFLSTYADMNRLANGSRRAGQPIVSLEILSPEQIVDLHVSENSKLGMTPDEIASVRNQGESYANERGYFDKAKNRAVINAQHVLNRTTLFGESPSDALRHEGSHALDQIPEFQKLNENTDKLLFTNEEKDLQGNVLKKTDGIYDEKALVDMYLNKYIGKKNQEEKIQFSKQLGLYNEATQQFNIPEIVNYMKSEVRAELSAGSLRSGLGKLMGAEATIANWVGMRQKQNLLARAIQSVTGLGGKPFSSSLLGIDFTPEVIAANKEAIKALADFNGRFDLNPEGTAGREMSEKEIRTNPVLRKRYGLSGGEFQTELKGVVRDASGKIVGTPVRIVNPTASEGNWTYDEAGNRKQTRGYGQVPDEFQGVEVPAGGSVEVYRDFVYEPDGKTPVATKPNDLANLETERGNSIRQALTDAVYDDSTTRLAPFSADGLSWSGIMSKSQIQAIKSIPESILPLSIKEKILAFNDTMARGDGSTFDLDYAPRLGTGKKYKGRKSDIYHIIPVGFGFSKAGNFYLRTLSLNAAFRKLKARARLMDGWLTPWGNDPNLFMKELQETYLNNTYEKRDGWLGLDPENPTEKTPLAEVKFGRFLDFMNMIGSDTPPNPQRASTPADPSARKRKSKLGAEEDNAGIDNLWRSHRLDAIVDIADTTEQTGRYRIDLDRVYKALMPAEEPALAPVQEERRQTPFDGITATYKPASGAELTQSLIASGTSLESFGKDTLAQLAESYGVEVPKGAKRGEIIDAINDRPIQAPVAAQPQETKFSFTTSTERDDAIKKLIEAGDDQGIRDLNRTTILSALADLKNIQVAIEDAKGVYKGDKEVSSIIKVTTNNQQDLNRVRSRIADAAKMFQQMEFLEEKIGAGKRSLFGETDEDGFKHMGSSTLYIKGVTEDQIEAARKQAGIDGLTLADGRIELYDRSDDPEFFNRVTALDTAIRQAGGVVTSSETGVASVKSYSEDPQRYAGTIGYDDQSLQLHSAEGESERLKTPLVQKLMGLMGRPMEAPQGARRSYFEAKDVTPEQVKKQAGIAQRFTDLPLNDLNNPLVKKAYEHLNTEIAKQYDYLTEGKDGTKFTSQPWSEGGEPYASSADAINDIRTKNSLKFLKTDPSSFGPEGEDFSYHPLLQDSGRVDANGVKLTYNDLFRAVHDAIAHGLFGAEFGPIGEESAWQTHMRTLDDPWARWALTTETRGQNSYVNYRDQMLGKDGMPLKKGDDGYIPLKERGFAEQKAALLPLEDSLTGDKKVDEVTRKLMNELGEDLSQGSAGGIAFMPKMAVVPERYTGTGKEEGRRGKYVTPPKFLGDFNISQYEKGGKFFDAETGDDLTDKTYENASISVDGGKPSLVANNESESAGTGPIIRSNLFKQKAGWKWISENPPETSTIVSVEGQGKHVYTMRADFQNGVKMARYPDKTSEPRLRPTGRGEIVLGNEVARIDIRGKEHPVYDTITIGEKPASDISFMPAAGESKPVPTQEELDAMKARLPKYKSEIEEYEDGRFMVIIRDEDGKFVGQAEATIDAKNKQTDIHESFVDDQYKSKGYGEALYREVAKYSQSQGSESLYGEPISIDALKVRQKLFDTKVEPNPFIEDEAGVRSKVPSDISFMPSSKLDEEYAKSLRFDANPETAQTYVNEAAEKAGYDSSRYWYHGTAGDRFNVPKGRRGVAAHVSLNKDEAWNFAESAPSSSSRGETKPDVRTWYLKRGELFDPINEDHLKKVSESIKPVREKIENQPLSGQWALKEDTYNPTTWKDKIWDFFEDSEIQKFIKDAGFIGYMDRESPRTSWENTENAAIFDSNSLKEAGRVTLDDQNNIIPLSQRFDTSKQDIRFMPYSPELPKTEDGKVDWEGFKAKTMEVAKPLADLSPLGGISFMPSQDIEMKPSDDGRTIIYQHDKKTTIKPPVKPIETLSGEVVGMLEADRHNTLGDNMGGPMHPFLLSNQSIARLLDGRGFKPVWANMNSAFVTRAKNIIKNTTSGRALIQLMKEEAHISNRKFVTDVMSELDKKKESMPKDIVDSLHVILELGARNPATKLKEVTAAQKAFKDGDITQRQLNKVIKDNQEAIDKYGPMVEFLAKLGSIKSKATRGNIDSFNRSYSEHIKDYQKQGWYKKIAEKYKDVKFADEAARFTFNQRGAAMKRLRGIAHAPDITKMLADSMDFKGGKNLDLVASVQLSKDPEAFAIYTGKDPKQEAKMSEKERYLRDQFMKNPKFKKHPSYDWMMLGPENADSFILDKPVDPLVLFPDYAKNHPKANVRNGSKETIVGTMKKSKIPLKIK